MTQHHSSEAGRNYNVMHNESLIFNHVTAYLSFVIIPHITAIVSLKGVIRSITEYGLQLNKEKKN